MSSHRGRRGGMSSPNPDRKSNNRKRQERIRVLAVSDNKSWWLEPEAGMLRPETLKNLESYRNKTEVQ